jgi:hypothetical protein
VEVVVGVGMLVMMAVMGGPPEGSLLCRRAAEKREEKLEGAAGLVTAVGKIAVKGAGDAEFAGEEHEGAERKAFQVDSGPEDSQAGDVNKDE